MGTHNKPSAAGYVETYIGSSFDVVKTVADNLDEIRQLANLNNMDEVLEEVRETVATVEETVGSINNVVNSKQNTLVSGTNIKTVNGISLLGSGNVNLVVSSDVSLVDINNVKDDLEQLILMGV